MRPEQANQTHHRIKRRFAVHPLRLKRNFLDFFCLPDSPNADTIRLFTLLVCRANGWVKQVCPA